MAACSVLLAVLAAAVLLAAGGEARAASVHVAANATVRHCTGECQTAAPDSKMKHLKRLKEEEHERCVREHHCPTKMAPLADLACVNGMAGPWPCRGVDLLSFVPLEQLGSEMDASDIWGWTDSKTGREYAMINVMDGTSFVDVTNPKQPAVLGFLPTHTVSSIWHDVKVFKDHAYIVSEAKGHGMQVFDLTQLRGLEPVSPVRQLKETAFYGEFGNCHNIVINEETGFAYAVGTSTCRGGLHMMDINDVTAPKFVGCFSDDGYTHDAQCVIYHGPDSEYAGREICFAYNEDTVTIVDVHDKENPVMLSRTPYEGAQYTHQGWLTADQTHLVANDELDEMYVEPHTRSMMWNVEKLTNPVLVGSFYSEETVIDHNLYIHNNKVFESNYCGGLRVLDASNIHQGTMTELAFFDVAPDCDQVEFMGSWSNYPYFESGTIIVSSIETGLFVLKLSDEL